MTTSGITQLCFVNCGLPGDQCACYRNQYKSEMERFQAESRLPITADELRDLFGDILPMEAVKLLLTPFMSPAEMRPALRQIAAQQLKPSDDILLGAEAGTDYTSPCCNDAVTALFYDDKLVGFRCEDCGRDYDSKEDLIE